jgi:molecular chaperone GrpE
MPTDPTLQNDSNPPANGASNGESSGATEGALESADAGGVQRELDEQRDKYLRLAAEYDNFRKRSMKERQEAHLRGQGDLVKQMIDGLDDLGRVAHVDPSTTDAQTVLDGVSMAEKKLLKALNGFGLEVLNPLGEPFDPGMHEAVMTEPAATKDEDHLVSRVFQPGHLFNGQLLRPARVVVKQWNG